MKTFPAIFPVSQSSTSGEKNGPQSFKAVQHYTTSKDRLHTNLRRWVVATLCLWASTSVFPTLSAQEVAAQKLLWSTKQKRVSAADLAGRDIAIAPADTIIVSQSARQAGQLLLARLDPAVAFDAAIMQRAGEAGLSVIASVQADRPARFDTHSDIWLPFASRELTSHCLAKGFDGWVIEPGSLDDEKELLPLLRAIRAAHPDRPLYVAQRADLCSKGVIPQLGLYVEVPVVDTIGADASIRSLRAKNIPVLAVATSSSPDRELNQAAYDRLSKAGAVTFVTTPGLSGISLAPERERPRKVLILFGWDPAEAEKPVIPETDSMTAELFQTPLEYLGYEATYLNVGSDSLPDDVGLAYAGVWFDGELNIPARRELEIAEWLVQVKAARVPIFFLSGLPFTSDEPHAILRDTFGLRGSLSVVSKPRDPELISVDNRLMNTEAPVTARIGGFLDLQAPVNAHILISQRCKDEDDRFITCTPAFLCSWGGAWFDPHIILRGSQDNSLFFGDPYAILSALMSQNGPLPAPDATTRMGLRMFYSHIDGDGFGSLTAFRGHPFCAELVRDRILKQFPLPVTVSIVQSDMEAFAIGIKDEWKGQMIQLARSIFALPNVSAASHSFAHPYQWDSTDPNPGIYDEPFMTLKPEVPYKKVDLEREIKGSIDYINRELLPDDKRVELMLWSGNCRPGREALRMVRELGLQNMNGGNTIVSRLYPGIGGVAPRVMPWGDELQIHAANQNEFMYANGWNGPFFGGFADVIDTFERTETPRRLKPVNVYYHFYSATSLSSLRALEKIHRWCMEQPLHPVTALTYANIAREAHEARIYELGPRQWRIATGGHVQTFSLPATLGQPDLPRSQGVLGWIKHGDSLFVHTDGRQSITLRLEDAAPEPPQPGKSFLHLASSSSRLDFSEMTPWKAAFRVDEKAMRSTTVVFSGLPAASICDLTINNAPSTLSADAQGRLSLSLPAGATVTIDAQRSRFALLR